MRITCNLKAHCYNVENYTNKSGNLSQGRIQLCRDSAKLMNPLQVNQQVALLRNLQHGVGVK